MTAIAALIGEKTKRPGGKPAASSLMPNGASATRTLLAQKALEAPRTLQTDSASVKIPWAFRDRDTVSVSCLDQRCGAPSVIATPDSDEAEHLADLEAGRDPDERWRCKACRRRDVSTWSESAAEIYGTVAGTCALWTTDHGTLRPLHCPALGELQVPPSLKMAEQLVDSARRRAERARRKAERPPPAVSPWHTRSKVTWKNKQRKGPPSLLSDHDVIATFMRYQAGESSRQIAREHYAQWGFGSPSSASEALRRKWKQHGLRRAA